MNKLGWNIIPDVFTDERESKECFNIRGTLVLFVGKEKMGKL